MNNLSTSRFSGSSRLLVAAVASVLFGTGLTSAAPTLNWSTTVDTGAGTSDRTRAVGMMTNGDVIAASQIGSATGAQIRVQRLANASGAASWTRDVGTGGFAEDVADMVTDPATGDSYIAARAATAANGLDWLVFKVNGSDGTLGWAGSFTYSTTGNDEPRAITFTSDGNIAVAGVEIVSGQKRLRVSKLNASTGAQIWGHTSAVSDTEAFDVTADGSGNVIAVGRAGADAFVVSLTSAGSQSWTQTFNGSGNGSDGWNAVTLLSTGDIAVAGYALITGGAQNISLARYPSAGGAPTWSQNLGGASNLDDSAFDITRDGSDNLYVAGYVVATTQQALIAKYSGAGSLQANQLRNGTSAVVDATDAFFSVRLVGSEVIAVGTQADATNKANLLISRFNTSLVHQEDTVFNGAANNNDMLLSKNLLATNSTIFAIGGDTENGTAISDGIVRSYGLGVVAQPNLSINDVTLNEGNSGSTTFAFTVSLSSPAGVGGVTFDIATANNTATAGTDYTSNSLTGQTISAGNLTYTLNVTVSGDTTFEPTESFFVNVTNVTGATVTDGQGQGTITNDDLQPTVSINSVSLNEGNAGPTIFGFTVSLSNASSQTITVNAATANNTATLADSDYTSASGTLTFIPGAIAQPFNVTVNGDTNVEPNETFFVNLTSPTNATLGTAQGTGTIVNDEGGPPVFINIISKDATVPPGVVDGASYSTFYDASINNANRVIFSAALGGGTGGVTQDQGTWTQGASGTLDLVLRAGTAIDGAQSVGRNLLFPRFGDNGVGVVQTDTAGAGPIIYAQWIDDGASNVTLFAKRTTVFASSPANSAFIGFTYTTQNQASGEAFFAASLVSGGAGAGQITTANDSGVWKVIADGSVTAAAREGDALPATIGVGLTQAEIQRVAKGPGTDGIYRSYLSGTGVTSNNSVIAIRRDFAALTDPVQVLRTDAQAADQPAGCKYYDFIGETINTSGKSLVWAHLTGTGVTGLNNRALFSDRTGSVQGVIRYDQDLSAAFGAGVKLSTINTFWLLDDNNVVVQGLLTGPGVTVNTDQFVALVSTAGAVTKLAREGDVAVALGNSVIDIIQRVDVSTGGRIALLVSTLNGTGDSAGNLNNQGLLIGNVSAPGAYTLALRKGSIIPGGVKQIWSIAATQQTVQGSSGSTAGMSRVVNNNGKVVVMLVFYDNDQGIFVGP